MEELLPIIEKPTLQTTVIHRGATNQMSIDKTSAVEGKLSWVSFEELQSLGKNPNEDNVCLSMEESQEQLRWAPVSAEGQGDEMVFDEPVGQYYLCLLDDIADENSEDGAPLNEIGIFEMKNVITSMSQSIKPSTRTTLRIDVIVLRPGTVTCVVKDKAVTAEKAQELASSGVSAGMSAQAQKDMVMQQRSNLLDFLNEPTGTLAQASVEVPAAVPPFMTVVLVMNKFPDTNDVPAWCWHSDTLGTKLTSPEATTGQLFDLPGENPVAKTLPTFVWPGASFLIYVENVHETASSRVRLVNSTAECDATTYDQAVPVVQNVEGQEQPIEAYLTADDTKKVVCFFELPNSLALVVETPDGTELKFSQGVSPQSSVIVGGVPGTDKNYIHRGLPVNLLLNYVDPGEDAQIFVIQDSEYADNNDKCLPAIGIGGATDATPEPTADYVTRAGAITFKPVSVLPTPTDDGKTHFVSLSEQDTSNLVIGQSYTVCYVGSQKDSTRVFNKVGGSLRVRDVIVGIHQAEGDQSNSQRIRLEVEASLTGEISCLALTRKLSKPPTIAEIDGTAKEQDDYEGEFEEDEVLGRTLLVEATEPNSRTTVVIENVPEAVKNIEQLPMGVAPQIFTWCRHTSSQNLIFPNNGEGVAISLAVLPPPQFEYATADGIQFPQPDGISLARNISFPPIIASFQDVPNFPLYYYDHVSFNVAPPFPAGIVLKICGPDDPQPCQSGSVMSDPLPEQLTAKNEYTISSQSKFDVQGIQEVKMTLGVIEPAVCELVSVKSTEFVLSCAVQDADNFYVQAVYLLMQDTSILTTDDMSSTEAFTCKDRPVPASVATPTSGLQFTCMKEDPRCCCWMFLPKEGMWNDAGETERNLDLRLLRARVKNDECGLEKFARYDIRSMASGTNPLVDDQREEVVSAEQFDISIPMKPESKPLQFEMKVDINYEENCSPQAGPNKEQECKDNMQKELQNLLGAPAEMIEVTKVRAA